MKLFGALLILAASGYAGILVAKTYWQRPRDLKILQVGLQLLETEITYARTALPQALAEIAKQTRPPVAQFFQEVSDNLLNGLGVTGQEAWNQSLVVLQETALTKQDIELVATLGNALGRSDVEDQCKHLHLTQQRLANTITQAEQECDKNARLWSYLGFCVGALVVVLLY